MTEACIIGWAHSPFGKLEDPDIESLIGRVAGAAIADAGIAPHEINSTFLSLFNNGFSVQDFPASLVLQHVPDLRFKPITRFENACASGSAAVYGARDFLLSGRGKIALVIGVEKMTATPGKEVGDILLKASYQKEEADIPAGFAGVFGRIADTYFQRYGDQSDALAAIAAKNHKNGVDNPFAQMRKDLGYDFCRNVSEKNPYVAPPLKRTDCSLVSDGAVALIMADEETARAMGKAVRFKAAVQVNDFLPISKRDITQFEGAAQAWARALEAADVGLTDLSFVESHDCFTIAELLEYEAMGLTPAGKGARAVLEGWTAKDGRLPINPSGGLKAKGHPIGATGVSMHAITAMQLVGEAPGGMQLPKADLGAVFNMGGAAVANYVSILEPLPLIPTTNLAALLIQTARRFPDRPAIVWRDSVWTWAAFRDRVQASAAALAARGVRHGDRVLLHARNSNAVLETMFATWMLGAVWVPTNFRLTPPEVAYLAQSSGATVHIFDSAFPDHAVAARSENPACRVEISIGGHGADDWEAFAGFAGRVTEPADVDRDHPAWFFYTSGTTGRPKAGVLTHGQMDYVVCNHLCDLIPATTEQDASLVVAPLSHGAGVHALPQIARGAATILLSGERLDCEEAWSLVERHRVTNMFTVPTILTMLTRHDAVDRYDHSSLRYVIYAGAPMYRADQVHALRKLGSVLVQYFGMGEVTGNITVLPPSLHSEKDGEMPVGSCGFPRTGMDVAILDENGRPAETGEICVRGPGVFSGYHNNPEATAKATAHGWFHTGDLGHMDARGFVYITGRASDMYISGGSNVYPREIEEALLLHPAVAEACVLGMPHEKWGESGVAVLVLEPASQVSAGELLTHLDGRLAKYKWPAEFVFWPELPKSGYGKVTKRDVKHLLQKDA